GESATTNQRCSSASRSVNAGLVGGHELVAAPLVVVAGGVVVGQVVVAGSQHDVVVDAVSGRPSSDRDAKQPVLRDVVAGDGVAIGRHELDAGLGIPLHVVVVDLVPVRARSTDPDQVAHR